MSPRVNTFAVFVLMLVAGSTSAYWPAGTVILTRNNYEPWNTSIGYINHLALDLGNGYVVESQEDRGGVIMTPLSEFMRRDYKVWVLFPRDRAVGQRAAAIAYGYVGRPYRKASSLAPLLVPPIVPTILHGTPDGMNCVSVLRCAYEAATGRPLIGFRIPDDVCLHPELFTNRIHGG